MAPSGEWPGARTCMSCAGTDWGGLGRRSDGIDVLACTLCGMGVVARLPAENLADLYGDDYYASVTDGSGYSEYDETGDHSTSWASALVPLLAGPMSTVLDVGCADGRLLRDVPGDIHRLGIEVSPAMSARAAASGVDVVAADVFDPEVQVRTGLVDLVTAIAVFEHLSDLPAGVRLTLDLLRPDGVLLFEVPVLNGGADDSTWFRSSLEHVWYPTSSALHALVERGGRRLQGGELIVRDYASTFVGLVSADGSRDAELADLWERLTGPTPSDLSPAETDARVRLRLVHAAQTDAPDVDLLSRVDISSWPSTRLSRLTLLWSRDAKRLVAQQDSLAEVTAYLRQVEQARDDAQGALAVATGATRAGLPEDADGDAEPLRLRGELAELALDAAESRSAADAEIDGLRREVADVHLEYGRLAAAHADQVRALEQVYASTAWRVAAPVRALGGARRRARQLRAAVGLLDRRRLRSLGALLRRREVRTIRERSRALMGQLAVAEAGRGEAERQPREPWPAEVPLVTVVIPCFNYGEFVEEAVRSALGQTLHRVEVVVVDGGSTDGTTVDVLRRLELELTGEPVRFLYRTGRHFVGDNRNFAIEAARGKYICCLDADDVLDPTFLDLAVFGLERQAYDVVSTAIRVFGREERVVGVLDRPDLSDMLEGNHVTTVGVFRRLDWQRAGGYVDTGLGDQHVFEDWRFWQRLVSMGARVGNISGLPLFGYRSHSDNSLSRDGAVPDLVRQRHLVREANADVISPAAIEESRRLRDLRVEVTGDWRDLAARRPDQGSLLLAVPFLLLGGAERMLSQAVAHLVAAGFGVVVVTTVATDAAHGDTTSWFTRSTDDVYHLPRLLPPGVWPTFVQHLVETKGVDTVWLAGSEATYAMLPALRLANPGLKVVDLLFNTVGHTGNNRRYRNAIDLTVCENAEVATWLGQHGETPDRVSVVPNGVDVDRFRPPVRGPRPVPLRIGFCGRLSDEKDPLAFVRLAARCAHLPLHFVIAGAGPLEADVRREIGKLRLRRTVEFLGQVDDVSELLRTLDVLVLPSRLDGRPNVVLEALATGLPVLATDVGGLPEMVDHGSTGWLYGSGDRVAPVQVLEDVVRRPEQLVAMGLAARAAAESRFSVDRTHDAYEQLFRRLRGRDAG